MSTTHKITITIVVLFIGLAATPAAVTAVDFPASDSDWDKSYDDGGNGYEKIKKVYVDSGPDKIQFRAVLDKSELSGSDGLGDSKDALQIYIDAGEGGIDSSTGSNPGWGLFFSELGAMNADYRITAQPSSAVVEEHETGIFFNTVGSSSETSGGAYQLDDNSGTDNDIKFSLDRETIGNPDTVDVKFAYIDGKLGDTSVSTGDFNWAPNSPVRIGGGGDGDNGVGQTATVTTKVQFGQESVDSDATVNIVLTDDNGNEAGSREVTDFTKSTTLNRKFTVDPSNFNGDGAEFSVEVTGDDDYTFERDVDNTKSIDNVDGGGSTSETLGISTLEASVDFSTNNLNPSDDASVEFTLTDEDGTETTRVVEEGLSGTLSELFTVNPANFDGTNAELTVEVVGDENIPYTETKSAPSVSKGNSKDFTTFTATGVGHEFTLEPTNNNPTINSDTGSVGIDVKLDSKGSGSDIHTVVHRIDFDEANLADDDSDGTEDIKITNRLTGAEVIKQNEEDGQVTVIAYKNDDNALVTSSGGEKTLYTINFEYEDGLQSELPNDDAAIEFEPSTSDATEIRDNTDTQLAFTSSLTSPIKVNNDENRITGVELTHLSEYANMKGFTSFEYEVTVETNDAPVDEIKLSSDAITSGSGVTETCGNNDNDDDASTCTVTFEQEPDGHTSDDGTYGTDQLDITAVMDSGSTLDITAGNDGVTSDDLKVTVHKTGDFAGTASSGISGANIRTGINDHFGEEAAGETWGADQRDTARYDVNGDREVGITDITAIIDQKVASP